MKQSDYKCILTYLSKLNNYQLVENTSLKHVRVQKLPKIRPEAEYHLQKAIQPGYYNTGFSFSLAIWYIAVIQNNGSNPRGIKKKAFTSIKFLNRKSTCCSLMWTVGNAQSGSYSATWPLFILLNSKGKPSWVSPNTAERHLHCYRKKLT